MGRARAHLRLELIERRIEMLDHLIDIIEALDTLQSRETLRAGQVVVWNHDDSRDESVAAEMRLDSLEQRLASHFTAPHEEFLFHGGSVTDAGLLRLQRVLQNAALECAEVNEADRGAPLDERRGAAYALALRPRNYSGFAQYER